MSAALRRIRVLMLLDRLEPQSGGGERFAVGLAAHLPRDRFEVTLCATREVLEPWRRVLDESGVEWFALGRRATWDVLPFRRLARFLRSREIDVLHTHMFGSNVWGSLIGRAARVPVVVAHEQTWDYEGQPLRKFLDGRLIGRLSHAFVAVSSADRDRMIALEHVPADKVVVELNAHVPRTGEDSSWDLRGELGLEPAAPVIGTACIFRPQKRLDVLIDAFARVKTPGAQLVLAGDGPERERLEAQATRLGLSDRVHFLGLRGDIDALLRGLSVAAMSSDFEGTPLFGFECMAAGTPLVATAVGGLPDMLTHGHSALLVPSRDPVALAAALDEVLADPARGAALAGAARAQLRGFEIGPVAARYGALYDRLLSRGPA